MDLKSELLDDYNERLRNAELIRERADAEIALLTELIEQLRNKETVGEKATLNRLKGQEGHG